MTRPTRCGRSSSRRRRRGPAMTCWRAGCGGLDCPKACMQTGTASTGVKGWAAWRNNWRGKGGEQVGGKGPQTHFGRAMAQLGVELILANSPQAKGRVERMNGLLQDRLVKALRLAGISDLGRANEDLIQTFVPALNRRFRREAASSADVHRGV